MHVLKSVMPRNSFVPLGRGRWTSGDVRHWGIGSRSYWGGGVNLACFSLFQFKWTLVKAVDSLPCFPKQILHCCEPHCPDGEATESQTAFATGRGCAQFATMFRYLLHVHVASWPKGSQQSIELYTFIKWEVNIINIESWGRLWWENPVCIAV